MAKQDYSTDVGMWAIQPDASTGGDTALDTLVPHFEKVWDGHSDPAKRACNVLMTYGNTSAWGYLPYETDRAKRQAYTFGEWMLRIKEANASAEGAGPPRHLAGIVFRGMWNLQHVTSETAWTPDEIQQMTDHFLGYFDGAGDSLPENKGSRLGRDDLPLLKGYLLGDDFARWPHTSQWDEIVQQVHTAQQGHSVNRPFYFTHQIFSPAIWNEGTSYGERLNNLKPWLNVFNSADATPVFMPQFYPWEDGTWDYHGERDPYVWWNIALDELLYLKNNGYPSLKVQPVVQAYAQAKAGPGHPDMHNQLRAVLNHSIVEGVWLLGWNYPVDYAWACYKPGDNRWTDKQHIAEAIQVEVGGAPEVILTSVPSSGMTDADPLTFRRQEMENRGSGGTRLKSNLDTRRSIRIRIEPVDSDAEARTQLDGYTWDGRHYSFDGPWNKAQYTRDPKLAPDHVSLNPLHGTSVNWNGWTEQDTTHASKGRYHVQLQDASGVDLGASITVTVDDGSKCFVATATYEDPESNQVSVLRRWRDEHLGRCLLGNLFIRIYYRTSPFAARLIRSNRRLKLLSKRTLDMIIYILSKYQ